MAILAGRRPEPPAEPGSVYQAPRSAELFISEGTVKIHLHNIYRKLAVGGRLELAAYAQRHGLQSEPIA